MDNFWTYHGIYYGFLLLLGLTFFPRLSLLVCNITGGVLFWISWLLLPRLVIAFFASIYYFDTNFILVFLSWVIALSGETTEKSYGYKMKNKKTNLVKETKYELINE